MHSVISPINSRVENEGNPSGASDPPPIPSGIPSPQSDHLSDLPRPQTGGELPTSWDISHSSAYQPNNQQKLVSISEEISPSTGDVTHSNTISDGILDYRNPSPATRCPTDSASPQITAKSLPDVVSRHWFTLPASKASNSDPEPVPQAATEVDDTIRDSLQLLLQPRHEDVDLPTTGFLVCASLSPTHLVQPGAHCEGPSLFYDIFLLIIVEPLHPKLFLKISFIFPAIT